MKGNGGGGGYVIAEPELASFRNPKCAVQKQIEWTSNSNNIHNHRDEIELYAGTSKRNI